MTPNDDLEAPMLDRLLSQKVNSFLIKGSPGAGKSTLAMELLRRIGKGTYVSTRVTTDKIPLRNLRVKTTLVRADGKQVTGEGNGPSHVRWESAVSAQDYQLAGGKEIVQVVFDNMKEGERGLIILDSWDSIAKELDQVERLRTEKTMVTAAQSGSWILGFVSEEPAMTTTDYLVDAVVELKVELRNDYFIRKVEVKKLRGQPIGRLVHLFSLEKGAFHLCEPTRILFPGQYKPQQYVPIKNQGKTYSTGVPDLDATLRGGFSPGSVIALELAKGTSRASLYPFDQTMWANFLANGGCAASLPPAGATPNSMDAMRAILPRELVDSSARVGYYERYGDPCLFQVDNQSLESTMLKFRQVIEQLKGSSGRPCLILVGVEKLEYVHGKDELLASLVTMVTRAKAQGDVLYFVVNDRMATKDAVAMISDIYVIVETMGDVLTVQAVKPSGPVKAVQYDYSRGYPQVSFLPMT